MILLSGGTKARHRGASLVRNLLYSPSTRGTVAQVSIHCELQCIRMGAVDSFSVVKTNACFIIVLTNFFVQVLLINAHYFAGAWDGKGAAEAAKIGR
jgi:accessory gene regulator protein AgrB